VTEVLAGCELPLGRLEATVTYHDACHLAHGQRVRSQPRALLTRIPGLRLVELQDSDLCCGSAGVYNLLEPEMAAPAGHETRSDRRDGARIVAASNGCALQIARGRGSGPGLRVIFIELLAPLRGRGRRNSRHSKSSEEVT
jgi:Fe-S oxidoreductase